VLSISQLCFIGYNDLFTDVDVTVFRRSDGSIVFKGVLKGKLYIVYFSNDNVELDACLIEKANMSWFLLRKISLM
jgi:hypothetical protein